MFRWGGGYAPHVKADKLLAFAILFQVILFLFFSKFLVGLRDERKVFSGYFEGEEYDSAIKFLEFYLH